MAFKKRFFNIKGNNNKVVCIKNGKEFPIFFMFSKNSIINGNNNKVIIMKTNTIRVTILRIGTINFFN